MRLGLTLALLLPVMVGDHVWLNVPLLHTEAELLAAVEGDPLTDEEGVTVALAEAASEADTMLPVALTDALPVIETDNVWHVDGLYVTETEEVTVPAAVMVKDCEEVAHTEAVTDPVLHTESDGEPVKEGKREPEGVYE